MVILEPRLLAGNLFGRFVTPRYQLIRQIGAGSMGSVYRALDRLTGQDVALKSLPLLTPEDSSLTSQRLQEERLFLANEFKLLAALRHPHIVSVLDYGFDSQRQPFFTMELLDDARPITTDRQPSLDTILEWLLQLLHALNYLHQCSILHRDLKPANILITQHNQVKLVDFGLAVTERVQGIGGTLAYTAPELLRGNPATRATDLYSVGMVLYELLAGSYPFNLDDVPQLILDIRQTSLPIVSLGLPTSLEYFLTRLVAKNPYERFQTAEQALAAFRHLTKNTQFMVETSAMRASFLEAARFIGRKAEMDQLSAALKRLSAAPAPINGKTLHLAQGSAWLIRGESGVGKTRLLEEMRILALVQGIVVLYGRATPEGGLAFQEWVEPLRHLCLHLELAPFEQSVLKLLIEDLEQLVGNFIADLPPSDAQTNQERLMNVVLLLFQRLSQPVVLILDDLHWLSEDSFALLRRVVALSRQQPLLFVGSYREEEAPFLYGRLSQAQILPLDRFTPDEMAELSVAMLGETGRRPQVLSFLEQQTEGNVFFMVEVLRTLAESGNPLNEMGLLPLPKRVASERIAAIIQQRLAHLPDSYRQLLRLAAVLGRVIDLKLLIEYDTLRTDQWLIDTVQAGVIHFLNEVWEFSHDQIREYLLAQIPPAEISYWHRQAATILEKVYPQQVEYAARLAEHWLEAGEHTQALVYYRLAGKHALSLGAMEQARHYFEHYALLAAPLQRPLAEQQEIQRLLVGVYQSLHQIQTALASAETYWRLAQQPFPTRRLGVLREATTLVLRHIFRRLAHPRPTLQLPMETVTEQLDLLTLMIEYYGWSANLSGVVIAMLRSLELAENMPDPAGRMRAYIWLSYILYLIPLPRWARDYWQQYQALKATNAQPLLTYLPEGMIELQQTHWATAQQLFETGYAHYLTVDNPLAMLPLLASLASLAMLQGDEITRQLTIGQLRAAAQQYHSAHYASWGYVYLAQEQARNAQYPKALQNLYAALQVGGDIPDVILHKRIASLMALCYVYNGDSATARLWLEKYQQQVRRSRIVGYTMVESTSTALEAYLRLYQLFSPSSDLSDFIQPSRSILRRLRHHARLFPLARPFELFWRLQYQQLQGKPITPAQRRALQSSLEETHLTEYFADIERRWQTPL